MCCITVETLVVDSKIGGYPFGEQEAYIVHSPDSRNALPYVVSDNLLNVSVRHIQESGVYKWRKYE